MGSAALARSLTLAAQAGRVTVTEESLQSLFYVAVAALTTISIGVVVTVVLLRAWRARQEATAGVQLGREVEELMKAIPEPPEETAPRQRHLTALENRARLDACRLAGELGLPASARDGAVKVWVLAGSGPTGALGLALARHLEAFGASVQPQLLAHQDRWGSDVRREVRTLRAAGLSVLETPHLQPVFDYQRLVTAVDEGLMSDARRAEYQAILAAARGRGFPLQALASFDAAYRPPPPRDGDPVTPAPTQPLSREDVRMLDSLAMDQYGMSSAALMENAGYWAAREAYLHLPRGARSAAPAVIVCGRGNNGGDGLVVARHLAWWQTPVQVHLLGEKDKVSDDALRNLALLESEGVRVRALLDASQWPAVEKDLAAAGLIVDAVLGTGMSGAVRGTPREAIARINAAHAEGRAVLALDCPSGLDCNSGEPLGACVVADATVTFAASKLGFARGRGPALCGRVVLADIGLPRDLYLRYRPKAG